MVDFVHFAGQGQQQQMYVHALDKVRREAVWTTFLDVDEFLRLGQHKTIGDFMRVWNDSVDSVHFNWLNFGSNGFKKRPPGSVLTQYSRRGAFLHQNTKHLSRASVLDSDRIARAVHPFWHGLHGSIWSDVKRVNVLGDDLSPLLEDYPTKLRAYLDAPGYQDRMVQAAVINHYMIKSEEDFILRVRRGVEGDFGGQVQWQKIYESGHYQQVLDSPNRVDDFFLRNLWEARAQV